MKIVISNQSGMALVVTLLIIVILTLIGTVAMLTTTKEMNIGGTYRDMQETFYASDAGNQMGISWLNDRHNMGYHPVNATDNSGTLIAIHGGPAIFNPMTTNEFGYGSDNTLSGRSSYTYRMVSLDPPAPAGYESRERAQVNVGFSAKLESNYKASSKVYSYYYQVDSTASGPQGKKKKIEAITSYLSEN